VREVIGRVLGEEQVAHIERVRHAARAVRFSSWGELQRPDNQSDQRYQEEAGSKSPNAPGVELQETDSGGFSASLSSSPVIRYPDRT